jgi:hypothetical protein
MQNQNGVRITLRGTTKGMKFKLGAAGVSMQIKQ